MKIQYRKHNTYKYVIKIESHKKHIIPGIFKVSDSAVFVISGLLFVFLKLYPDLHLTDEEQKLLNQEGISLPNNLPLTKVSPLTASPIREIWIWYNRPVKKNKFHHCGMYNVITMSSVWLVNLMI